MYGFQNLLERASETPRFVNGVYGGYLYKIAGGRLGTFSWHRRWFELKGARLSYAEDSIKEVKQMFFVRQSLVRIVPRKYKGKLHCFLCRVATSGEVLELAARDEAERRRWYAMQ